MVLCCGMGTTSWPWGAGLGTGTDALMESPRVKSKILELPMGSSLVRHGHPLQSHTFLQELLPASQEPWKTRILQEGSEG